MSKRNDVAFAVAVAALAGGFFALQWLRFAEPLALDQGLFACFTRWVPRGWLPYRDLFDSKPPLFLSSYALARLFPGTLTQSVWALEAVWLAANMALCFAVGRRLDGRWAGLAAAALLFVGLWAPGWGGYWSRAQAEELLVAPLVGAAWAALAASERPRAALWCGVLTGVVGLFKVPAMVVALAWPALWLGGDARGLWRRLALLIAGALLPWMVTLALFAALGSAGSLVDAVFVYPSHYAATIAPGWSAVLSDFLRKVVDELPGMLLLAAAGVVATRRRARVAPWLVSFIVASAGAIVLQRQLADYHFLLIVPSLALAAGLGLVHLARASSARGRSAIVAALLLLATVPLAVRAARGWQAAYAVDVASPLQSREAYLQHFTAGPFSAATVEMAARLVREHTRPDQGILVWGLSPGIYALAYRHPVTRYAFHQLLLTEAPLSLRHPGWAARRREFLDRLNRDPPAYILVGTSDANGFEPEESSTELQRFTELRALVERDYERTGQVGRFLLYRRRTGE